MPHRQPLTPQDSSRIEGVQMLLHKSIPHRWDRLAQNHTAVKNFLRKDWVQDDGEVEEEKDKLRFQTLSHMFEPSRPAFWGLLLCLTGHRRK